LLREIAKEKKKTIGGQMQPKGGGGCKNRGDPGPVNRRVPKGTKETRGTKKRRVKLRHENGGASPLTKLRRARTGQQQRLERGSILWHTK